MLLMRISKGRHRWEGPETFDWLEGDDAHAMALSDLIPTSDRGDLSFYRVDGAGEPCERVAVAIAVTRERLGKVDYVLLHEAEMEGGSISLVGSSGRTFDPDVNSHHVETEELSASKALMLARAIRRTNQLHRLDDRCIAQLIDKACQEGRLDEDQLHPKLRDDLDELR